MKRPKYSKSKLIAPKRKAFTEIRKKTIRLEISNNNSTYPILK